MVWNCYYSVRFPFGFCEGIDNHFSFLRPKHVFTKNQLQQWQIIYTLIFIAFCISIQYTIKCFCQLHVGSSTGMFVLSSTTVSFYTSTAKWKKRSCALISTKLRSGKRPFALLNAYRSLLLQPPWNETQLSQSLAGILNNQLYKCFSATILSRRICQSETDSIPSYAKTKK